MRKSSAYKNLWAPWRMEYISTATSSHKKCVFCKIFTDKNEESNFVVYRSNHCFIVMNIFPYNNGHLLIVTNRHIGSFEHLKDDELYDLIKTSQESTKILKKVLNPHGFNIGMNLGRVAGAGIEKHLHIHIVPRWDGDTNFMPVCSGTKVISQGLRETYNLLKNAYAERKR